MFIWRPRSLPVKDHVSALMSGPSRGWLTVGPHLLRTTGAARGSAARALKVPACLRPERIVACSLKTWRDWRVAPVGARSCLSAARPSLAAFKALLQIFDRGHPHNVRSKPAWPSSVARFPRLSGTETDKAASGHPSGLRLSKPRWSPAWLCSSSLPRLCLAFCLPKRCLNGCAFGISDGSRALRFPRLIWQSSPALRRKVRATCAGGTRVCVLHRRHSLHDFFFLVCVSARHRRALSLPLRTLSARRAVTEEGERKWRAREHVS